MATARKVLGNTIIQIGGKALTALCSLIIVKILTGFGPELYGNYLTAYEFLAFFGIIADAGLFAIAVRELTKSFQKNAKNSPSAQINSGEPCSGQSAEKIFGNIFGMRLILIAGVMMLAGIAAQFIPNYPPVVKTGIWITAISMGLTIVAGTLSSILQARMKIQFFTGGLVLGKIALATMIYWLSRSIQPEISADFWSLLWAGVISNVVFLGCVWWFVRRELPISIRFDWDYWKTTLTESLPFGLALILQTLYLRADVIIISIILGSAAVGTYGVATRLLESFLILGVFFGQAMLPKISAEESDPVKAGRTLGWASTIILLIVTPILIAVPKFSAEIILLLSSEEFLSTSEFFGSDSVLAILIITVLFAFFNQLFTFTLVAKKRQNHLLKVNAVALALNIGLNIAFLSQYGIIAAAISTILCELLVFGLLIKEIRGFLVPQFKRRELWPLFFANGAIAIEIYLTPIGQHFILSAAVCSLSYVGIIWAFRKRYLESI